MGYYININESNTYILKEHLDAAYKAMCDLNHDPKAQKGGASYSGGKQVESYFSWMEPDYDKKLKTADDILKELGFFTDLQDDGNLYIEGYDSKIGDESQFLDAIAPFVNEDAYIVWRGEDGSFWKWTPTGTQEGVMTFVEATPPVPAPEQHKLTVTAYASWITADYVNEAVETAQAQGVTLVAGVYTYQKQTRLSGLSRVVFQGAVFHGDKAPIKALQSMIRMYIK